MERREKNLKFLSRVPIFSPLNEQSKKNLADALQVRHYSENDIICKQGEAGNEFFIIEKGSVQVLHDGQIVDVLNEGDHFGEIALIDSSGRRQTTIRVSAEGKVTVGVITREVFFRILGVPLVDSLRKKIPFYKRATASVGEVLSPIINQREKPNGNNKNSNKSQQGGGAGSGGGAKRKKKPTE